MKKHKVAITTTSFGKYDARPLEILENSGFEAVLNHYNRKMSGSEIVKLCKNCIGVIAGTEMWDRAVMRDLKNLRVISRCGTGLDNVDSGAAKRFRMQVL